ncbi:MAG: aminotransferase class V-fold PLP-dependent enzyme, partial [Myxococcota bacterium]
MQATSRAAWAAIAACAGCGRGESDVEPSGRERVIDGVGDVEFLAAGDIALSDLAQKRATELERAWAPRWPYRDVADRVRRASVSIASLDGVLSDRGARMRERSGTRAPGKWAEGVARAGFDVVSLAGDHVLDWGPEAAADTARSLRAWGVTPIGLRSRAARHQEAQIVRVHGMRIAFLAYTGVFPRAYRGQLPGPFPAVERHVAADAARARARSDAVVVSLHFGREWDVLPTDSQRRLADAALQGGATIVVGHHPRVLQPLEVDLARGRATAFSLGALVADGWPAPLAVRARRGALLAVRFSRRTLVEARLEPITHTPAGRPALGGDVDVASLSAPTAAADRGESRDDLLARLRDATVARGTSACGKFRDRPPAGEPLHEHFACGAPAHAVGRAAIFSGGSWREGVAAVVEPGAPVTIAWPDTLMSDAVVGWAGIDDDRGPESARESVRRFLNAPSKDQLIFTRNATEAINLVAQSFGSLVINEGDEIVLS